MTQIVIRFTYRNHLNEMRDGKHEFPNINDLKNYLRWEPDRAQQIGYGKAQYKGESRNTNVRLSIVHGGKETCFKDALEFVQFLKSNQVIARALQYRT